MVFSSQLSLTALGMFVTCNKAKLVTVQATNRVLEWPKCHCLCEAH